MTKKDFIAVARILSESTEFKNPDTVRRFIGRELSAYFASNNPRFDVERFEAATGIDY